jgi:hypothetical protein
VGDAGGQGASLTASVSGTAAGLGCCVAAAIGDGVTAGMAGAAGMCAICCVAVVAADMADAAVIAGTVRAFAMVVSAVSVCLRVGTVP